MIKYRYCIECKAYHVERMFNKDNNVCNKCKSTKYNRSMRGIMNNIYRRQIKNSTKRGHHPPTYTKQELIDYIIKHPMIEGLYNAYVNSKYNSDMIPSIDRIDSSKGYSMDNIQLCTWLENKENNYMDMRTTTT